VRLKNLPVVTSGAQKHLYFSPNVRAREVVVMGALGSCAPTRHWDKN